MAPLRSARRALQPGRQQAGPSRVSVYQYQCPAGPAVVVRCDAKQPVSGLKLELGGKQVVALGETTVPAGGAMKYTGGAEAVICTEAWKEVGRMPVDRQAAQAGTGVVELKLGYVRQKDANLKLEVRTLGPAIAVGGKK